MARSLSMHQVSAAIWNRIAETQTLATEWAQQMFPLPEKDLDLALEREEGRLAAQAGPHVAVAYLRVMPLLWEREAISRFLQEEPNLRHALPVLEDASEAVMVASRDSHLTASEKRRLHSLLQERPL
jgi:hypothetical protein